MSVRAIAKILNLSPSTVSLALRGSDKIAEETRLKIEREAARMGYKCDAKLRELMARMRDAAVCPVEASVGLLVPRACPTAESSTRLRNRIRRGLTANFEAKGYRLDSFCVDDFSPSRLRGILDTRGINGLICFADDFAASGLPEALAGLNVVAIGGACAGAGSCVAPDYFGDMVNCCRTLVSGGFGRIGLAIGADVSREMADRYVGGFLSQQSNVWQAPWLRLPRGGESSAVSRLESWIASKRPEALVCAGIAPSTIGEAIRRVEYGQFCFPVFMDLEFGEGTGVCCDAERISQRAVELLVQSMSRRGAAPAPVVELVRGYWIENSAAVASDAEASAIGL